MRRRLMILALLGCTALTPALAPTPAQAGPALLFIQGLLASGGLYGFAGGAIASALGGAAAWGFAAGSFLFGSVLGNLVLSLGLSAISSALTPKPQITSPSDRMVNFAQAITPMDSVFGLTRKGGPYALSSFQHPRRHYCVILAAHEIDGVDSWYIDDRLVEVDGAGLVTTEPYDSTAVSLRAHLGAAGQTADAQIVAAVPEWTSAHDMAGLAYVAAWAARVANDRFSDVYGNSPATGPVITPVIRGAKVYDPRTDTVAYSNNAQLVWAWITTERLGQSVDWDDVAIEADACDVLVTNTGGGSQRKWTINGSFADNVDYESLRAQIIAACDGYMYERPDGTLGLQVGRYVAPTITLTEDDFLSLAVAERDWGLTAPTEFVGRYPEPDFDFRESSTSTLILDAEAVPVRQQVALYFVDSHNQAARVIKRIARSRRADYSLRAQIGAIGYEILGGNGGKGHRFVRVLAHGFDFVADIGKLSRGESALTFTLEATSAAAEDYDFDAATEEGTRPARSEPTNDNTVPPPSGLAGTAVDGPGIAWEWDAPSDALSLEFRARVSGAAVWEPSLTFSQGETLFTLLGLVDGESYEAQVRHVTAARRFSAWSSTVTVVAVASATPPDDLQTFTAIESSGDGALDWQNANDPAHAGTRIYRADYAAAYAGPFDIADGVLIATEYGAPNAVQSLTDPALAVGVHAYWAAPINSSGIAGTLAGPQTFEIT